MSVYFENCCKGRSDRPVAPTSSDDHFLELIEKIALDMIPLVYQKGQVLFYEGHVPYGLFVIKKGRVKFMKGHQSPKEIQSLPSILGYQHLVSETPYCASCLAETEVKAVFLPKAIVQDMMKGTEKKTPS